ncbi:MAG: response regulator [Alphaproteobacteria bacterium]|nr:response regulator [Alphaproteobacteria bacterium SS10]
MHREYDLSAVNVLVVEDSDFMRSLMADILDALSVGTVVTATNGEEAKGHIEASGDGTGVVFDIVFSDWAMEPVSGIELLNWVREHPNPDVQFIPFIMVSAYSTLEWVIDARDDGVTEFLTKPVSVKTIVARLTSVIEKPRAFVKAAGYFGPDRRRRDIPFDGQDRRKR